MANFVAECIEQQSMPKLVNSTLELQPKVVWKVKRSVISMVIWDDEHGIHKYLVQIYFPITSNVMEYEATIFKVMTLWKLGALDLVLFNDLRLVINQYVGIFEEKYDKMRKYL